MSYGLKTWDSAGNVSFDSTLATGGVCLGLVVVGTPGLVYTFPDIVAATGVVLNASNLGARLIYTTDSVPGYLRFSFDALCSGLVVALFAK